MYAFSNLPQLYKIAVLLGARVEVFLSGDNKWFNHTEVTGLSHNTPYRIVAEDEGVMEQVKELVSKLYTKIQYRDYEYLVPNNALKEGSILIIYYGLGQYVQVQKDGSFKELTNEEARNIFESTGQKPFVTQNVAAYEGSEDKHE